MRKQDVCRQRGRWGRNGARSNSAAHRDQGLAHTHRIRDSGRGRGAQLWDTCLMSQAQAGDATGAAPDWWAAPAAASGHTLARGRRAGSKPAKRQSSSCVPAAAGARAAGARTARCRVRTANPRCTQVSPQKTRRQNTKLKSQNSTATHSQHTELTRERLKKHSITVTTVYTLQYRDQSQYSVHVAVGRVSRVTLQTSRYFCILTPTS